MISPSLLHSKKTKMHSEIPIDDMAVERQLYPNRQLHYTMSKMNAVKLPRPITMEFIDFSS